MANLGTNTKAKETSVTWRPSNGITPEVKYLLERNKFEYKPNEFAVKGMNGWKIYPATYGIRFHSIQKAENGAIEKLLYVVFESKEAKQDDYEMKIEYLTKYYGLIVDPDSDDHYYTLMIGGKWQHFSRDTEFEFFNTIRTATEITFSKFNVVLKGDKIWYENQGTETPELKFLIDHRHLVVDPDSTTAMYRYEKKKGEATTYPSGSRIVFHNIILNQDGEIVKLGFQFQRLVWR